MKAASLPPRTSSSTYPPTQSRGSTPSPCASSRRRAPAGSAKSSKRTLPFTVFPYVLPSPQQWRCHLDLWQHNSNIARTFGTELWSDEHFAKMETGHRDARRSRPAIDHRRRRRLPVAGLGLLSFERSPRHPLRVLHDRRSPREKDGRFSYDFSALRRYIELCFSYGIRGDITVYGLMGIWSHMPLFPGTAPEDYPEQVLIRYLDEADGCYHYLEKTEDILSYIRALFALFREMGVFHLVRIGADEPSDLNAYNKNVALLRSVAPDIKFKMALDKTAAIRTFCARHGRHRRLLPLQLRKPRPPAQGKRRKREGARLLFYVCNIPKNAPNTVLHRASCTRARPSPPSGISSASTAFCAGRTPAGRRTPPRRISATTTPPSPRAMSTSSTPQRAAACSISVRYFALRKRMLQLYGMPCTF